MDSHLILKIIHMTFGSLALIAFLIRAVMLFWAPQNQPGKVSRIVLVAMQHLSFTVLIVTGIVLLYQNQFVVQPWFYGKIILFVVILSATIKAFGKRDITLAQRKAGVIVAGIAFAGLFTLVIWKPDFSGQPPQPQSPIQTQRTSQSATVVAAVNLPQQTLAMAVGQPAATHPAK